MQRVLVTGANGQIGSELTRLLRRRDGIEHVVGADLEPSLSSASGSSTARNGASGSSNGTPGDRSSGSGSSGGTPPEGSSALQARHTHEVLDVRDRQALGRVMEAHAIDTVFHLASLLSATGEEAPGRAWDVNMNGLRNVLTHAREAQEDEGRPPVRVFWPSSIAVFGPGTGTPAPQQAVLDPQTMYGITKVSGELLCRYSFRKYGVDVRSVRYPGLISYAAPPGGGTTDYAPEMCYAAAEGRPYTCFVGPETRLPMMYMPDALRATMNLMDAPTEALSVRTSYNVGALSFTASELAEALSERAPAGFECRYQPDPGRQQIADSWPASVEDEAARSDWGWRPEYDLEALAGDMLENLQAPPSSSPKRTDPSLALNA